MKHLCRLLIILASIATASAAGVHHPGGGSIIPPAARAAGFLTNTFSTNSNFSSSNVDTGLTYSSGFQWYFVNFFGATPNPSLTTFNSDGSVTTTSAAYNGQLTSAGIIPGSPYFVGTAFGGGAYMEAEISFDPTQVDLPIGHPSWWMMSVEHLDGDHGDQWAGQPAGYSHYVELDVLEWDLTYYTYGGSFPEYWGIYGTGGTCPPAICRNANTHSIAVPGGTVWTQYHRAASLWIPATSITDGTIAFYFDDILYYSYSYTQFTSQSPPPTGQPWAYGVIDQQHLALIFGSQSGPISVRSVNVWQKDASGNITN